MLTIVFISLTAILAVIALIQHLTINRRITRATRKTEERYKTEIKNFESDIDRLNYLLEEKKIDRKHPKKFVAKRESNQSITRKFCLGTKKTRTRQRRNRLEKQEVMGNVRSHSKREKPYSTAKKRY